MPGLLNAGHTISGGQNKVDLKKSGLTDVGVINIKDKNKNN
jgi:hypothetical protein